MVSYTYNPQNQLTAYTDAQGITTNYTYAPDGLRSSKTQNGATTKFYWDRGFISAESQNGSITAENYIGINGVFARKANNTTAYMLKNGHGDVVSLLQNGAVVKTYDYDAYGKEKNIAPSDTNPFRYCSEYFDQESGSIYLRNRYYAPDIGRFITEDPVRDGLNWYGYCGGNPIIRRDPNGASWEEFDSFLPQWAQDEISNLTQEYIKAGDSKNEFGGYVRDDIHRKAMDIRNLFIEKKYLNYAIKDFNTFGINETNYLDVLGILDEDVTFYQTVYTYAMELQNSKSTQYMVRNKDGSLSDRWLRSVRIIGGANGTPRNNQAQNRQARDAANKYNLSKEGKRLLHDRITKRNFGYQEILDEAAAIAELGGKYVK